MASAPKRRCAATRAADVEVGHHVAVGDDERVVDARRLGGETDRSGRVERLGLDGIGERDVAAATVGERLDERLGPEAERQHDLGHPATAETSIRRAIIGHVPDGQHRLGDAVR